MNKLTKHLIPEIIINSQSRLQRMRDHKAIVASIAPIREVQTELILIGTLGGSLLILCFSLAQTILTTR